MQPDVRFLKQPQEFWAFIRFILVTIGYSMKSGRRKGESVVRDYTLEEIRKIALASGIDDRLASDALLYLKHRTRVLNDSVRHFLMNRAEAAQEYRKLIKNYKPSCHLPFNKQKGSKKHLAYFTCIINILTEKKLGASTFEDNPGRFITIKDSKGKLIATLSRRIDGAYPSLDNPKALWEIKEYYGTTTFGSRVADGVYETQLDGYELRETEKLVSHRIGHYLFIDDYYTWWDCGRSYLCRLIDIMHMGLVDEVIFGREVLRRWPVIIDSWSKVTK